MRIARPVAVFGASLVLLALALVGLDDKSFWLDEGYSVSFARLGLGDLFELTSQHQANMSLYYFLLHFWMGLGDSETVIRLLSVVFAVATVPLVYALGARLFDASTGLVAALLFAVNSFVIRYAQEARGYTLALFLATAASYLFVRALRDRRWPWWIAWGVVGGVSTYAHFFCGLVVTAHLVTLVVMTRRGSIGWRVPAIGVALVGVLVAPLAAFVAWRTEGQISWIPEPELSDFPSALTDVSGGGLLLGLALLALAVYGLARPGVAASESAIPWRTLLAAWFLVPVFASFAVSFAQPVFLSKYLIVVLPALALAAAYGLMRLGPLVVRAVALVAIAALAVAGLVDWYGREAREPWRAVVSHVVDEAHRGDAVILFSSRIWNPFNYYLGQLGSFEDAPALIYPDTGWGSVVPDNTPPVVAEVSGHARAYERVWLVLGYADGKRAETVEALSAELASDFDRGDVERFKKIRVVLYD